MSERACASCGTANEADARFCEGCGTALERTCGACGVTVSATARFCRACGAALDAGPGRTAAGPTRKTVTVLFADLAGSTAFEEVVDAETAREVIGRYHDLLRSTAERHRAGVTKYIGDGFMAVWGVPEIGADDAEHAVEAAVELQERFVGLASRVAEVHGVNLALRVAVNTGEVVVGADDADLVGDALNVGARLESECPHGHVVVGEETWRSTRGRHRYEPMGSVQVKGRTAPVSVYQWLGQLSETADAVPFVGRSDELRRLRGVFDEAVATQNARLVTVSGDPGVGKTRLAAEFVAGLPGAHVIRARCAVEGSPALAPLVEMLRTRDLEADVPGEVAERDRIMRDLKGMTAGVAGSVEETFWALRRFVEVLASEGPVVIVVDDIQWADTLLIDFVEHLAEWIQDASVLVLGLARPELRETRPDLVTVGGWVSEALHLRGLEARATAELAAQVLGSGQLPEELLSRLPSSTGGNPLFVRELVGMLVHDGVLVAGPEGWRLTVDVDAIAVPPTIQALLASRLERLNPADRRVLEVASVIGTDFSPTAVGALAGQGGAEIAAALKRLRRLDLAQPSGTYAGDEPVWRFHHVLIRDVAYRRLLKSDRAELHERLADWVQGGGTNVAFESDEVIARHLEAAHGYRLELGLRDEHTDALALRSARNYLASARRALDRDELVSAGAQAARGAGLATADSTVRAELLLVGCEALLSAGDVAAGAPLVDDLEQIAGETLVPWAICYRCQLLVYTDPTRLPEVDELLHGAIEEFARRQDAAGLAKAHRVRANARARLGRVGDCELDLFEALIAARQGGDHRQITAALGAAPNAALWGPSPAPKAGGRCLDVVRMQRMTTTAPSLEATSLRCLAVLELLRGRPDKARTMLADARQVVADLGLRHGVMETELFAGIIELMVGDPVAAEPHFRTALEGLDALGVGADAGQAAALLARSVLAQGRIDEADRYAAESERIAGHNLKTAIAWRAVRAEILSAHGQHAAAVELGREAVAVAAGTDLVLDHADACMALSRVLAAAGDERGAAAVRHHAESPSAAKDAVFMVGRTADGLVHAASMPSTDVTDARLKMRNRATRITDVGWRAMLAHDADTVVSVYSDRVVYDDRRRLSGDPIESIDELREAARRNFAQYPHVQWRTLAIRGETLELSWARWWDDAGNEATTLHVYQVGDDDLIEYHGRFDEDYFEDAYRELERRYYAGEGAAFAENGRGTCAWMEAMWRRDVKAAGRVSWPHFRWLASPSALKPAERSVDEFFEWLDERAQQVSSMQLWAATIRWMSPNCLITLTEIQGAGADGEEYLWSRIYVGEYRDGLASSIHEFDVEEEDAAFAYAESLVAQRSRRLVVSNRASESTETGWRAMRAHDVDTLVEVYSDRFVYDDRRRLSGDPVTDRAGLRAAFERVFEQLIVFEGHTLAVRGERLALCWSRWSDDDGNQTAGLFVFELGDDGRTVYLGRFDEDDFWAAYRKMETRYYAGEGAAYAESGLPSADWVIAISNADIEGVRRVSHPEFRWIATPSALKDAERTIDDMFRWMQERARQVSSQRHWVPVLHWLSPNCAVGLGEIEGVGGDGEKYDWNVIHVTECRDGLLVAVREFDDEQAAFTYAEGLAARQPSRLSLSNAASRVADEVFDAMRANDADTAIGLRSQDLIYDDRRRIAGALIGDIDRLGAGLTMVLGQYKHIENRTLAVRGERLWLGSSRWRDDAGNEAAHLHVIELGGDGLIANELFLDEDDFETAYTELERRYYAGEGKPYAGGAALIEMVHAENRGDLDGTFRVFLHPGLRIESRSRSVFPTRTAEELRRSVEELGAMVTSYRVWSPAYCWLSNSWVVARHEREAVGRDGQTFSWSRLYVGEIEDGLFTSLCEFDIDDEDAAFAYAEERMRAATSRLAVCNRASEAGETVLAAFSARDAARVIGCFSDRLVYDDRRPISGEPIADLVEMRPAVDRMLMQYNHFESRVLAVRGERLSLGWARCSDDAGNETRYLGVFEVGDDGLINYQARFDEDDFDSAYRELEARYYDGEGAAFAKAGARLTDFVTAANRGDLERAFRIFGGPNTQIKSRSRSIFPDRNTSELRSGIDELMAMVSSVRWWYSALCWLSPDCAVVRQEREATGPDGENYAWTQLYAGGFRGDVVLWGCEFDVDDEDAAFAYAEERMRATSSRLAVTNRASEAGGRILAAMRAHDLDGAIEHWADQFIYDDRRRYGGDPLGDRDEMRRALQRIFQQYNRFEVQVIAIRGERLNLARHCWSDDAGNQTATLTLAEIDEDGRVIYEGRFEEDDFDSAYHELERRYYAGEGSEFAANGLKTVSFLEAMDTLDVEAARLICHPTFKWFTPASTLTAQERSLDEVFRWITERARQTSSIKNFASVMRWLSPTCCVALGDVRATGTDGGEYTWARIYVGEIRDGQLASLREFEDEQAAFAYAEMRVRVTASRLAVTNAANVTAESFLRAMQSHDRDAMLAVVSDDICFDDHRRLSGDPIRGKADAGAAIDRILQQFNHFEPRTLAVRGERLALCWSRWSDDSGNATTYLHVIEISDDGRIVTDARFDEDDFDSAYQELESRYYSGEGAAFAESGTTAAEVVRAGNRGDLDKVFGDLASPGLRVQSRSGTIFPDRTVAELRDSVELFRAMVSSSRSWFSAVHWLAPNCAVARQEREAGGEDDERYAWTRMYVVEFRDGLVTAVCDFDMEFEEQAFAYAEERMRAAPSRLAVGNRATETVSALIADLNAKDIDGAVARYSEHVVYTDRRRLGGALVTDFASVRSGVEVGCRQYSKFEGGPIAVRGDNLALGWDRFSDERGNLTQAFELLEVGDDGRIVFHATFDEDDFEGAYRELETRYYAGEGADFAESGLVMAEYITVKNRGDLDTLFNDLSTPDVHIESRSRSVFLDRSAAEYRASLEELNKLVGSVREWLAVVEWMSPRWCVALLQREAVGDQGGQYEWTRIVVSEVRGGRFASACQFEPEDEDAAFTYAEERVSAAASPLAVSNAASRSAECGVRAIQSRDVDAFVDLYSDDFVFEDRRRLSGELLRGKAALRATVQVILTQYDTFEWRTIAVRGETLALCRNRWSDRSGNESQSLHLVETDRYGVAVYQCRFDEDDFEGAYRALETRYYAGEGAGFAEYGLFNAEYVATMNRGDFDTMFNELTSPDLRFENQSRSVFPDRSATELRANFEDLYAMLESVRSWFSAVHWLSPTTYVGRLEREGLGRDGEQYAWSFILVNQYRDGRLASICEFDEDDDAAAHAYAEELARQT